MNRVIGQRKNIFFWWCTTYAIHRWFLHMIGDICNIHSHRWYLRTIKLACRRRHICQHVLLFGLSFLLCLLYSSFTQSEIPHAHTNKKISGLFPYGNCFSKPKINHFRHNFLDSRKIQYLFCFSPCDVSITAQWRVFASFNINSKCTKSKSF